MNKHIYITRKIPDVGLKILKEKGISFDIGEIDKPLSRKKLIKDLKKKPYDGVIDFLNDTIDKEIFDACKTAKVFANYSVGFNNIDIEEAKKRDIAVSNTPGTSALAVAEHAVALIMSLTTRLVEGDYFARSGKYEGFDPCLLVGTDLTGKTIGLIGGGEIGSEVARILYNGFNCKIIYSDIVTSEKLEKNYGAVKKSKEEILQEADIISLHVPLLKETTHLINKDSLKLMKKTSFLINTSRGPVVCEKDLIDALKEGTIRGAGLDVFEFEPKITKELRRLNNVILTPHIASSRSSCRNMMAEVAVKNIVSFFETGQVINSVIK